jgi:hypothetical protein
MGESDSLASGPSTRLSTSDFRQGTSAAVPWWA